MERPGSVGPEDHLEEFRLCVVEPRENRNILGRPILNILIV